MPLSFYEDYIGNYAMQRHLGIQDICKALKQIRDEKTPNCASCGQWFPKKPTDWYWNEDLHRYEWHCTSQDREIIRDGLVVGWRIGCVTGVGEAPIVRHSGFESVDELTDEEIDRLRRMGYTDEMLGLGINHIAVGVA